MTVAAVVVVHEQAKVMHADQSVTDRRLLTRRTWWHWRGIARFVRKHPERLKAL